MNLITRYILMVMVAVTVSWGLSPNEVQAIGGPCPQLALLDQEVRRLEENLAEAENQIKQFWIRYTEIWDEMNTIAPEVRFSCCRPDVWRSEMVELLRFASRKRAHRIAEVFEELMLLYQEQDQIYMENYIGSVLKIDELERELAAIPGRRAALAAECRNAQEMADPMASSGPHEPIPVEPEPVPSGPRAAQAAGSENQASANEQATQRLAPPTIPAHLIFPGLSEAAHPQGSSAAAPAEDQTPSSQTLTGQTMQVQQGNTNTGTNATGYTHMPLPRNAGQSRNVVTPKQTLRVIPRKMPTRVPVGPAMKK